MISKLSKKDPVAVAFFLVAVGVCAALNVWKLPPALPALQAELGLSLVESGFLLSSVQVAGMLLGLATGLMADRIGLRRCLLIGLAILSLASLGTTLLQSKSLILLSRALEGFGFLMVVLPAPALIKRIVPADTVSRIMGLWGCYMPAGAVVMLLGGSWLLSVSSWRVLWLVVAGMTFFVFLLSLLFIPKASDRRSDSSSSIAYMVLTTLRARRVWLVALIFGLYAAQWSAVIGFLPSIYAEAKISGPMAGLLSALVAGSNIVGNLLAGRWLYQGVAVAKLLISGYVVMIASAMVAFGLEQGVAIQFFAVLVLSIVGGLIPATCFFLAVSFAPNAQTTSSTIGWVQQGSAMGQFFGAPLVAWVVSLLGGWQWAWVATGGLALAGIAIVLWLNQTEAMPN